MNKHEKKFGFGSTGDIIGSGRSPLQFSTLDFFKSEVLCN